MKAFLAILLALHTSFISYSQDNYILISAGKWNSASTWSMGHTPRNGETAIIPKDSTLIVDNNMTVSTDITLKVYGNLNFQVGKLRLSANSVVLVYPGGTITSAQGNSSDKIDIGGVSKYTGSHGTLEGPLMANAATTLFDFFPVTLPVRFVDFSVAGYANGNLISWETVEEEQVEKYLIERSIDGRIWQVVGQILPSTQTEYRNKYSYNDNNNLEGLIFYRVKQVDKQGHSLYTHVKSISMRSYVGALTIKVVDKNVIIKTPQPLFGKVEVSLITLSGHMVAKQTYEQPNDQFILGKPNFKGGHYIIFLTDGRTKISKQVFFD